MQRTRAATPGLLGNECAAVCSVGPGEAGGREACEEAAGAAQEKDSGEVSHGGQNGERERIMAREPRCEACLSLSHGEDASREPERKGSLVGAGG